MLNKKLKITCLIPSMECGGQERQLAYLTELWQVAGHQVSLLTMKGPEVKPFFSIAQGVKYQALGLWREQSSYLGFPKIIWALRKAVLATQPDLVLTVMSRLNLLARVALFFSGIPLVLLEPNAREHLAGSFSDYLRLLLYPLAKRIIFLSGRIQKSFPWWVCLNAEVIPYIVQGSTTLKLINRSPKKAVVIGVGRLVRQKGFDILIKAWKELSPKYPNWRLVIWGEGPLRKELNSLITESNLSHTISLAGSNADLSREYQEAEIFVLSSRYEGFPNALCEAMTQGLAVVAFDCPSAVRDLINDGQNGLLVEAENQMALTAALERLLRDSQLRKSLGEAAMILSHKFSPAIIAAEWERVIADCLE